MRKASRIPGPAHPLPDLQTEIQRDNFDVFRTSALERIMRAVNCSITKARKVAKQAALQLQQQDYAYTLEYPDGTRADVYGKQLSVGGLGSQGWYIKLMVNWEDEEVEIASCHLAEHPIETQRGTVPRARRWRAP